MYLFVGDSPVTVCTECGALVLRAAVEDHRSLHIALAFLGELVAQDVDRVRA